MVKIKQYGGLTYDTDNYPYILINKTEDKVTARFSTLEKAHQGRLMEQLNNQDDIILLMNNNTGRMINWRKKEKVLYNKYKYDVSAYFESLRKVK